MAKTLGCIDTWCVSDIREWTIESGKISYIITWFARESRIKFEDAKVLVVGVGFSPIARMTKDTLPLQ